MIRNTPSHWSITSLFPAESTCDDLESPIVPSCNSSTPHNIASKQRDSSRWETCHGLRLPQGPIYRTLLGIIRIHRSAAFHAAIHSMEIGAVAEPSELDGRVHQVFKVLDSDLHSVGRIPSSECLFDF